MRPICCLFVVVLAACPSKSPSLDSQERSEVERAEAKPLELVPFETESGPMGYRDTEGRVRIEPQFQLATSFRESGLAWVVFEDRFYWIDATGKRIAQAFPYDNGADDFVEGRARIVKNGKVGFIDESGKVVVAPQYDFLTPLEDGRASFCNGCSRIQDGEHWYFDGGEWGFIDRDGQVLSEPEP